MIDRFIQAWTVGKCDRSMIDEAIIWSPVVGFFIAGFIMYLYYSSSNQKEEG